MRGICIDSVLIKTRHPFVASGYFREEDNKVNKLLTKLITHLVLVPRRERCG